MDGARSPGGRGGGRSAGRRGMRAPQERTVRDLYDRTRRQRDLAATEEQAEGRRGGCTEGPGRRELVARMEDKTVRKRLVSNDDIRVKAESGTCNVCCAPCSSCLHRSLAHADANIDCGSSQTCSTRSEIKNNSLTHSEKGVVRNRENDEEFSAASSNASFSETGGSKLVSRSSIAEDSPEVDMPAKRRRLSNENMKLSRAEYLDDNNSCVSDMPAEGKLLLEKKKLSASASTHDLTVKNCKGNNIASHSRLRKQLADESTEKNQSSVTTKKLLRMHSSASVSNGLSPKRQAHELGEPQENSSHQRHDKAWLSNNTVEQTLGGTSNPYVDDGENNDMVTGRSGSTRNAKKDELSSKDPERDTSLSKDQIQQDAVVQTNDDSKRNGVDKLDWDQDSSMDMSINGKLNIQKDVMIDYGNSEVLIDVNVCDICGDVGREYLLATCTRCLEGAEHTYCMRVKLDKVPDGEWLCEECHFKDDLGKTRCEYGVQTVNVLEGKKQCSENENNPKPLQVVPNLDTLQINCNTATAYQCDAKHKKMHLASADTQPQQVKVTNSVAERLEVKNKKKLSLISCKKLDVVTSELEGRSHDSGIPTPSSSSKKKQSSEVLSNRKKLRVCTDMESPLSSEGLQSPTVSCKRLAENASPPNPRLSKAYNPKKRDVFSRENSFKKSNEGSLSSLDKAPMRTAQAVKSSQMLSRSYSMGSMANAKAPVSSPRGLLSKQLSFSSSNNGPKVKQLTEGVVRKLRPVKHSPKDTRDQRPIKEIIKSGSFKSEGLVCKDAGSSKQKQSFHVPQDEKSVLKSMKQENMMERRASFSFKKPNIPASPRPVSYMKSGERKLDQDILRPGPSILKSSKKPGNTEKESYDLPKTDKCAISVHQKPTGFISGKDIYGLNIPDPPVPSECVKRDSSNDGGEDDNGMPTKPLGVLPTTSVSMSLESRLHDTVPRASALEESSYKVVGSKQKPLESTLNSSCNVEPAQVSDDTLPQTESPHSLRIPAYNKLYKSNLKQEAFHDQSTSENPSRDLVIPEQSYIWQGSFEVSRHGIPEIFDGIQAYLSTSASFKVREVGKQLPHKIQLVEAPRHSTWPLQFKEVNPSEDNIALFFFAKDAESYERAYIKLLEGTLLGDLSLSANIGGIELLIFPSDKLPERTQRWNGSLFFWGVFYARKASSLPELPVSVTNKCSLEPITEAVSQHDVCFPKAVQSLVIDLNECPNDDLSDLAVSLGPEMEKTGAPVDYNICFESKHEDRKLNACEIHHEGTSGTRQIVSGHPTAFPHGTHFPKIPTGHDMVKYYPTAAKDTTVISGNINMDEEGFCQHETLFCVAPQAPAVKSFLGELVVKNQAFQTSTEVSLQHFIGSKISDEPNKLISNSGIVSSDSDPSSKRQKTYNGKHSACSFEELPSKCMSMIHPLSTGQQGPSGDAAYICGGSSDICSLKKPITDHVIHVLSSDDEESPKPSTRFSNKASLKADEGSSPLLSLSLSTVATNDNLAGSDIGEDEPLSLSLGLPGVVDGSQVFEMKQFLPEKPGINT